MSSGPYGLIFSQAVGDCDEMHPISLEKRVLFIRAKLHSFKSIMKIYVEEVNSIPVYYLV